MKSSFHLWTERKIMSNKKSPKDMAFEKERAKYRGQIRELEREIKNIKVEKIQLKEQLSELEQEIENLKSWIERLLEYTELSEEEMKKIIMKDKINAEIASQMASLNRIFGRYF